MAKFIGCTGDLVLRDGEKITFGDGNDSNLWFDGSELRLDTVISGVDPTQDYHLTTKWFVDNEIDTLSGTIPYEHDQLIGLGDDDHLQYVPRTGIRGFTGTVSGIDPTQPYHLTTRWYVDDEIATLSGTIPYSHGDLLDLDIDDHTQYILVDGTRAFTGVVGGITPTDPTHLTTKQYVDSAIYGLDWQNSVLDIVPVASGVQTIGNRYIASVTGGGWIEDYIYEWTGTTWSGFEPNEGFATWVEDEDVVRVYNDAFPAGDWVRFGTTVIHNYLSGLQGGDSSGSGEMYHLTYSDYQTLISGSTGITDASDLHHHDSLYSSIGHSHTTSDITDYTETTQDLIASTISGAGTVTVTYDDINGIVTVSGAGAGGSNSHGDLDDLDSDDHTQYILVDGTRGFTSTVSGVDPTESYHLTTKWYVDDEIATLSGTIPYEHDQLTGLDDDDHIMYVPTDGSRGFTSTVSGIDPVEDYHLATKFYVDQGGVDRHGRYSIANDVCTFTVTFSGIGHTNYTITSDLENTTDSPPSVYAYIISARTTSSFDITLMGDTDSANYVLNWSVIED